MPSDGTGPHPIGLAFVWLCLTAALGCAGRLEPARTACGVCEEPARLVRLQRAGTADPSQPGAFEHPLRLDPQEWRRLLSGIRVQELAQPFLFFTVKADETDAFTAEDREALALPLSRAFGEASRRDWVAFVLTTPGEAGVTKLTSGVWYVEGRRLHLVLANFRAAVTMQGVREIVEKNPLHIIVGSELYRLLPGARSQVVKESGGLPTLFTEDHRHVAIDYAGILSDATAADPSPEAVPAPSIEERLVRLRSLHERGLITDEEYRAKRQEMLDRL